MNKYIEQQTKSKTHILYNLSPKPKSQSASKSIIARPKTTFKYAPYTYYIDVGNNSILVKKIIEKRNWFTQSSNPEQAHFRWKPTSRNLFKPEKDAKIGFRDTLKN